MLHTFKKRESAPRAKLQPEWPQWEGKTSLEQVETSSRARLSLEGHMTTWGDGGWRQAER